MKQKIKQFIKLSPFLYKIFRYFNTKYIELIPNKVWIKNQWRAFTTHQTNSPIIHKYCPGIFCRLGFLIRRNPIAKLFFKTT